MCRRISSVLFRALRNHYTSSSSSRKRRLCVDISRVLRAASRELARGEIESRRSSRREYYGANSWHKRHQINLLRALDSADLAGEPASGSLSQAKCEATMIYNNIEIYLVFCTCDSRGRRPPPPAAAVAPKQWETAPIRHFLFSNFICI